MAHFTRPLAAFAGLAVAVAAMTYSPDVYGQTAQCGGQNYNTATQVCVGCGYTSGGLPRYWIRPRFDANGNPITYNCCGFGQDSRPFNTGTTRCLGCGHDAGGVPRYWIVNLRDANGNPINWTCCGTGTQAEPCVQ